MVRAFELSNHKPSGKRNHREVKIAENKITFTFHSLWTVETVVDYQQEGENCKLTCLNSDADLLLENSDFLSIFCEDLSEALVEEKSSLLAFNVFMEEGTSCPDSIKSQILNTIKTSLSLRNEKLECLCFRSEIFGLEDVMDILSYIIPEPFRFLNLRIPDSYVPVDIKKVFVPGR